MSNIVNRVLLLRKKLGMSQEVFAREMGFSRGYLSQVEAHLVKPGAKFTRQVELMEKSPTAYKLAGQGGGYPYSNVDPVALRTRKIPIYTFVQAGQATAYEGLPTSWDDTIEYDGPDETAFALRVTGDSMMPNFPPGTIITVSPKHPPGNGHLVVAKIKNEGVLFKLFHHSGDGKKITLTSYNSQLYPPITRDREQFHWIYRVVRATQNL